MCSSWTCFIMFCDLTKSFADVVSPQSVVDTNLFSIKPLNAPILSRLTYFLYLRSLMVMNYVVHLHDWILSLMKMMLQSSVQIWFRARWFSTSGRGKSHLKCWWLILWRVSCRLLVKFHLVYASIEGHWPKRQPLWCKLFQCGETLPGFLHRDRNM